MDITKKKILKAILIIILIIIILLLYGLFLGGKSFSKYRKNMNSNSLTDVAKPIFNVDGASNILIDGIEDTVYSFSVKNYDNTGISDTEMQYYIEIVNNSRADLEFILTKNGQSISLNSNKTNLISLSSNRKQDDNYELRIKYHSDGAIIGDIEGNVQIKVEAAQKEINR